MSRVIRPIVVAVCADCKDETMDAVDTAYMAGLWQAIRMAEKAHAYWAKDLEALIFGDPG